MNAVTFPIAARRWIMTPFEEQAIKTQYISTITLDVMHATRYHPVWHDYLLS